MGWREWTPADVRRVLEEEWCSFNTYVMDAVDLFSKKTYHVHWHLNVAPPIPTIWPPQKRRSITYYALAEYQRLFMHGPALSRSAPWAKVVVDHEGSAKKVLISDVIGPVVHTEVSVPITRELAERKRQIMNGGEARLLDFTQWTSIPEDTVGIRAIKDYYCQWALTDKTAGLIENDHSSFFDWLSCPPETESPVLA